MNYYNEYDKKAAAWLRELITWGCIAPGIVDERSIKDVRPNDLAGFTQCHFFAGIGVWSYALRRAGWPDSRPVWTGSCPCQPFSAAGRGDGVADERHLWPHFFQLIAQCRPADVLGEQVASKDGLAWLDLVQSDMEGAQYAFGAADLCAAGVGAPHIRQRLFFAAKSLAHTGRLGWGAGRVDHACDDRQLAHSDGSGSSVADAAGVERSGGGGRLDVGTGLWIPGPAVSIGAGSVANTQRAGLQVRATGDVRGAVGHDEGRLAVEPGHGGVRVVGHAESGGWSGRSVRTGPGLPAGGVAQASQPGVVGHAASGGFGVVGDALGAGSGRHADGTDVASVLGNTDNQRLAAVAQPGLCAHTEPDAQPHGSAVGLADALAGGWAGAGGRGGREGQVGTDLGVQAGGPGPTHGHWAAADWIFCRDGKWRPVEPGSSPLAHGAAERVGRLRGYGNAIVAEVAEVFIASYLDIEGVIA